MCAVGRLHCIQMRWEKLLLPCTGRQAQIVNTFPTGLSVLICLAWTSSTFPPLYASFSTYLYRILFFFMGLHIGVGNGEPPLMPILGPRISEYREEEGPQSPSILHHLLSGENLPTGILCDGLEDPRLLTRDFLTYTLHNIFWILGPF